MSCLTEKSSQVLKVLSLKDFPQHLAEVQMTFTPTEALRRAAPSLGQQGPLKGRSKVVITKDSHVQVKV